LLLLLDRDGEQLAAHAEKQLVVFHAYPSLAALRHAIGQSFGDVIVDLVARGHGKSLSLTNVFRDLGCEENCHDDEENGNGKVSRCRRFEQTKKLDAERGLHGQTFHQN